MRGSTQALVKVVFFHLRGHGHLQDNATPNLFPDSKSFLLGLSNEVSFVSGFFRKCGQNSHNIFLKIRGMKMHLRKCTEMPGVALIPLKMGRKLSMTKFENMMKN